jgi:23S rRNA (pseudouridine1915-N3)-methyltransferase
MKIRILAVGSKMPAWVTQGFNEYAKRLPKDCALELIEIPVGHRAKNTGIKKAMESETKALLTAIKPGQHVVALDVQGKIWSTEELSEHLRDWRSMGCDVNILIGGPDGYTKEVLQIAKQRWSMSKLTLPHPLVRVVLAEQIYRAWTILQNHPYHK